MEIAFEKNTFSKRLKSMLMLDMRRMFTTKFLYIMLAICLVMPVLILVMTTMMDGSVSVDPQTGEETVMQGFDNAWQIIGSVSAGGEQTEETSAMSMSITSMCNINMIYFLISVLVCVFVSDDFRSGYSKNLFTVRAKKTDYVISKTIVCFIGGALMILMFFIGSIIGGAVAGLPFDMQGFGASNLIMCIITKMLLVMIFVPIYLVMSVTGKHRLWLSIMLSFGTGMFLFMMIPMISPLDAGIINIILSIAGGAMFAFGIGAISNLVLKKTSLI